MRRSILMFLSGFVVFWCTAVFALEPVIVVLGPPGSGKGNFSQFFKETRLYNHLSAGDVLRQEIEKKTPVGLQIKEVVDRGDRIDAGIMQALMVQHIDDLQQKNAPFIIDGFGVQENDIEFLHHLLSDIGLLSRAFVVFLDADDTICKQRMSCRLICNQCEHIYNIDTLPPKVAGRCDLCSGSLIQRSSDIPDTIEKRLLLYRRQIEPNYKKALPLFPSLCYRTDASLECCSKFYEELALKISAFQGSASEFLDQSFPVAHVAF